MPATEDAETTAAGEPVASPRGRLAGLTVVSLLAAGMLAPFLDKAIHLDDTLFVRLAERILEHPTAPYAFDYNWFGTPVSFWEATQNPPGNGYLLAWLMNLFGKSEVALHSAYLGIAVGSAWLMYLLSARLCRHPTLATCLSIVAPMFLVTATNLMADIPLLFFWLLAIWAAVGYVDTSRVALLWVAGGAAAVCVMLKYFGLALVPLLTVYVLAHRDRRRWPTLALLLPVVVVALWSAYSFHASGRVHPLAAMHYAIDSRESIMSAALHLGRSAAFLGGTLLWPVLLLPALTRLPRWLSVAVIGATVAALGNELHTATVPTPGWHYVPYALMVAGGFLVPAVASVSCRTSPNLDSLLLASWLFGTLVFAAFVNWTVNARILLPALLPSAIMVLRWIESLDTRAFWIGWLRASGVGAAAVSLLVAQADTKFANANRAFAQAIAPQYVSEGEELFFAGHWGFQYYMEEAGAVAIDYERSQLKPGDRFARPFFNSNIAPIPTHREEVLSPMRAESPYSYVHTMNFLASAGFYSSQSGMLPFNVYHEPLADQFTIVTVAEPTPTDARPSLSRGEPRSRRPTKGDELRELSR